jgi:anti-sigma factor (TIGR02949 family)
MTPSDIDRNGNLCEWALERMDAYLDGDLGEEETSAMRLHVEACAGCRGELELAEATKAALRSLPERHCPDAVTGAVMERISAETPAGPSALRWWEALLRWKPLRPATVAAALVLIVSVSILIDHEREHPAPLPTSGNDTLEYTPEQVALAEAEVKWTIAYIGEAGRLAGVAVRDKAIYPHVIVPVKEAIETAGSADVKNRPH